MVLQPETDRPVRVLSLDAGGIRGIIELHVLVELEERSGKPISELFDLIVGTSTGAAITIGMLMPGEDGVPKFTAREMLGLYEEQVRSFTEVPWYHTVMTLDGWLGPRYSIAPSRAFVERHYGITTMGELLGDAVVVTLDLQTLKPKFLSSRRNHNAMSQTVAVNFLAADVVMACCSVPAYIPPMLLRDVTGEPAFVAVDGGAFAYAPSPLALGEALSRYPGRKVTLLSLGTGSVEGGYTAEDARSWGSIDWASATVPIVLRSQVRYAEDVLATAAAAQDTPLVHYLRLSPAIPEELDDSLFASEAMIAKIGDVGRAQVEARSDEIQAFVDQLVD
jgi:patatin-like phospholipase/acyl hydrolase